jgi:hypothetical protein
VVELASCTTISHRKINSTLVAHEVINGTADGGTAIGAVIAENKGSGDREAHKGSSSEETS